MRNLNLVTGHCLCLIAALWGATATAATDRVRKLRDYAEVPSLRAYLLLEETAIAATLYLREPGGPWIATAHPAGVITLPALGVAVPLADCYEGLEFAPRV